MGIKNWKRVQGIIKPGHKVASGQATDSPYPQGTITMQIPYFQAHGLDLSMFYPATLNISISPYTFTLKNPRYTFQQIVWTTNHPPETFSFSSCHLIYQTKIYQAWIYYPHPETKKRHFQNPAILEIIAPFIPGLHNETHLEVEVNTEEIVLQ